MSNVNYRDAPDDIRESLENPIYVNDLLPTSEEFVRKTKKEKITIAIIPKELIYQIQEFTT